MRGGPRPGDSAAGRTLGPTQDDGRITLFLVDPNTAVLTRLAECTGTTYGGIAEHDGRIYISHAASDVSAVYPASVPLDG